MTKALLKKNVVLLDKIADTLIEKETIEKEEFESLIKKVKTITKPKTKRLI